MAALPDAVPVDKLESLVLCLVCLEILNDPRTLPCFHSFCKCCLEKFVKSQRDKAVALGKKIEDFNCPSCRSVFNLKENEEVATISGSYFIRNMLDVMAIQRQTKVAKCSQCEKPSCCRCVTCELFMCEQCLGIHKSWSRFKKHTVLTISELSKPENQAKIKGRLHCNEHENKRLKFYCETCEELICRYCMDFNHVRPDHSCLPIEKVAEKHREALKSSLDALDEKLLLGNQALEAMSNATQALKVNAEKVEQQINKQKEEVKTSFLQKLEETTQLKINEVHQMYNKTHEHLTMQRDKLQVYVDEVKGSANLSKNLLEKGNSEEIIASQKMIKERVEKVKRECPKKMKPVHDGEITYESMPVDVGVKILDTFGRVVCKPASNPQTHSPLSDASIILKDEDEYVNQMEQWLDGYKFKWHLCYRASRDGWKAKDFHSNCDDKGPTVTLVKVNDYIFGGFSDRNWKEDQKGIGVVRRSTSSFLFSLRNKDNLPPFKCPVKMFDTAVISEPGYGPIFGSGDTTSGLDLFISSAPQTRKSSYCDIGGAYEAPDGYHRQATNTRQLLAGSFYFMPTEMEVFN